MAKIIGNTTATPVAIPDWKQIDEKKADYIKNKPELGTLASKNEIARTDLATDVQESLNKANSALQEHQSLDGLATEDYVSTKIAEIPTPDVSGQINAHDTSDTSHSDIRDAIPNSLSDLSTDATHRVVTDAEKSAWNAKADITDIPTKVSDLNNDVGYITDVPDEIYVGDGSMPEGATIQILMDGSDEEQALMDELKDYIDGEIEKVTPVKGVDYFDGEDGYTPIKGVDYYTEADKSELSEYIASELAKRGQLKPEFANSVDECTDTSKLYVLPDNMIWAYMLTETEVTIGGYTNLVEGKLLPNYRISITSAPVLKQSNGIASTATSATELYYIPVKGGDVIRVNKTINPHFQTGYARIAYCDANFNKVAPKDDGTASTKLQLSESNGVTSWIVGYDASGVKFSSYDSIAYMIMGITLRSNGTAITEADTATVIVTKNEEIIEGKTEIVKDYAWANTGHAFVPADYESRIVELEAEVEDLNAEIATLNGKLENTGKNRLTVSEVFAPSPQLPADGSETADFNGIKEYITAEHIYAYIDALLSKYPRFLTKEIMGKDASGTHDWCRYVCSRRAYDAWQKPNYPHMYAWANGSTVIYSVSVSPRIGDTMYSTAYIGTAKGTVSAVSNANQSRTVGGVVYTRDKGKDIEPTLVYTETAYSPYFSSQYAGYKNGIYDGTKAKISTVSSMANGILTGANGVSYTRYSLGDRNSKFERIPAIVIGGNEHGTGGDPATPAMVAARMVKDLCECKNADNPFINLLKNEYMMVFCPVVNPWGLHKDNHSYCNSNGVNLDRNFDTPGWMPQSEEKDNWNTGSYGGSENETQYFINTLVASKCKLAMCNHSYGEGLDYSMPAENREAVSAGICSYMLGRDKPKYTNDLLKIADVMAANYNLVFNKNSDTATPETAAKTRSYIEWIGADCVALEMNSREGFITDGNGAQFTARVMEAAYTQLLQVLYMMIDKAE